MRSLSRFVLVLLLSAASGISPCLAQSAPGTKMPDYFGVFARLTDGSLVELEKHPTFKTRWLKGYGSVSISTITGTPFRPFTVGAPKPEIDLAKVDHFLIHGETKVSESSLSHFIASQRSEGQFFDIKGETGSFKSWEGFLDLGDSHDAAAGLRAAKLGENLYKVFFPEAGRWQQIKDELLQRKTKSKLPIDLAGLYYEGAVHQFRLKKPLPEGPPQSSFTLDFTTYGKDKAPGFELGEALILGEQEGKPVLKGEPGAQFDPANLRLAGDFTVSADISDIIIARFSLSLISASSRHDVTVPRAMTLSFDGTRSPIPLKLPPPVRTPRGAKRPPPPPPPVIHLKLQRRGDKVTLICEGKELSTVEMPAAETVEHVRIGGFNKDTAIHAFSISSP